MIVSNRDSRTVVCLVVVVWVVMVVMVVVEVTWLVIDAAVWVVNMSAGDADRVGVDTEMPTESQGYGRW